MRGAQVGLIPYLRRPTDPRVLRPAIILRGLFGVCMLLLPDFYYVSALAGAGKTHSAITLAVNQAAAGANIAIIQPSRQLISESYVKACEMRDTSSNLQPARIRRIDSNTSSGSVQLDLIQFLKVAGQGNLLFITHQALLDLHYWHNANNWTLIIDEVPEGLVEIKLTIPMTHGLLTSTLVLEEHDSMWSAVHAGHGFTSVSENRHGDEVYKLFRPICEAVKNPGWEVYVQTSAYLACTAVTAGQKKVAQRRKQLCFYAAMSPALFAGFGSVVFMGAMFEESGLYTTWIDRGVELKQHSKLTSMLRYQTHAPASNLTISYLFDHDWSKALRNRKFEGEELLAKIVAGTASAFGGEPFIYFANEDVKNSIADDLTMGTYVSTKCHGLNRYSTINNVAYLAALNPSPQHAKFAELKGVSREDYGRALYCQSVYQGVLRTSLRDPANSSSKQVLVMDKRAAEYLHRHLPGSTLQVHSVALPDVGNGRAGRPLLAGREKPMTPAQRSQRYRAHRAGKPCPITGEPPPAKEPGQ